LKVLHVYRTYFPDTQGGAQEVVRQISLGTSALGVSNRIFTPSTAPDPAILNHPEGDVHRVKLNFEIASCGFCITGIPEFRRCVEWADIVHYHFPWPFADALHFLANVQKPTLVTYHSDVIRQQKLLSLYSPLMKRFLKSATKIVCTSPNYLASSKVLGALGKPCSVIPIGLDSESYPSVVETELEQLRQQYKEDFFLFVGLLRYYKGLHTLLEAAKLTSQQIVIVGEGPLEKELKQKAKRLGLSNVHFTGYLPDSQKMALIELCRALVLPCNLRSEAFGVCLLEGAMKGKPLISAEVETGTSFVNLDSETGIVVPPENAQLLAEAMNRLAADPVEAKRLGKNARARFESVFTSKQMADAYLEEYEQLLG
tara:strand:- start:3038 stop:4147 length:1110 start_codon:yes stop_codon:yes gene_type:complete